MSTLAPPRIDAERAVVGGCILSPSLLEDVLRILTPEDFRSLSLKAVFVAIERRHRAGDPVDANLIAADLPESVTDGRSVIAEALAAHGSSQTTLTHARDLAELAAVRRIESIASQTLSMIQSDGITDASLLLDSMTTDLAAVDLPNDPRPLRDVWVAADLLRADFPEPPWIAPGFLRETWRLLFVGVEGGGKSTMLRQIACGISCGQHPFTFGPIEPRPALIIDCENPASVVRDGLKLMQPQVADAHLTIMSRPGGLNIRDRRDRDELHRVFSLVQPKVACIGPLYKLYRQEKGEPDEQAAVAAQNILDELRVAYDCAVVLETHAPKGGAIRELIPFGSSAWMRWPELGWKLIPCDPRGNPDSDGESVKIGTFRGNRVQVATPARFDRDHRSTWPWNPHWPKGIPDSTKWTPGAIRDQLQESAQ